MIFSVWVLPVSLSDGSGRDGQIQGLTPTNLLSFASLFLGALQGLHAEEIDCVPAVF